MIEREANSISRAKGNSTAPPPNCRSTRTTTKNSIAKRSTIIFFRVPNYRRTEAPLASYRKWSTIITSGRIGTRATTVARNPCAKPISTTIITSQLCRRYWKDIPGPVLSPSRSHKMKHKGAPFVRCNGCQSESISRRIFIGHKLQKAPTGDQCEDCKVKFSEKTARRGRTISDVTEKSRNGQRRRNRDSEQRFIFSSRGKTFSTAYKMEREGESSLGSCSLEEERRHRRCASRTRFFKTATIVANNLP